MTSLSLSTIDDTDTLTPIATAGVVKGTVDDGNFATFTYIGVMSPTIVYAINALPGGTAGIQTSDIIPETGFISIVQIASSATGT